MLTTATINPPRSPFPHCPTEADGGDEYKPTQRESLTTEAIAIPVYGGSTVEIEANEPEIAYVEVGGVVYERVAENPTEGQYTYDSETGTLTIGGSGLIGSVVYAVPTYSGITNLLNLRGFPQALRGYLVDGDIGYTTGLDHPSLSVTLTCLKANKGAVLAAFTSGLTTIFAGGTQYRLVSKSVSEEYRSNAVTISLGFRGIHAPFGEVGNPLDEPVQLRSLLRNPQNGDEEEDGDDCQSSIKPSNIFEIVNLPLRGVGAGFSIKVARDVSPSETITARQAIEGDLALVRGLVPRYDRGGVELINPDSTASYFLSDSEIIGNIDFEYGGTGSLVGGIPLVAEWKNAVLELDTDPTADPNGAPSDGDEEYTLVSKSRDDPSISPFFPSPFSGERPLSPDAVRTVNGAFDNGGKTDTIETTTYLNGQVTRITKLTYGFVYTSVDIFDVAEYLGNKKIRFEGSSGVSWRIVRSEVTEVKFDNEGYESARITTGWELTRAKKESEIECLELIKKISKFGSVLSPAQSAQKDALIAQLALYGVSYNGGAGRTDRFVQVPIAPTTTYSLEPLTNYYGDIPAPQNKDEAIARFVRASITQENTIQTVPNPESTDKQPLPPIVYGRYQVDRNRTDIISANKPEVFETRSAQETRESENLNQSAETYQYQQNAGRPSVHNRLERRFKCKHPKDPADKNAPKYKYLISTVNHPNWEAENGSIRFEGAYDFGTAIAAARLKARIDNMDALTVRLELRRAMPWRSWDTVFWQGQRWKVAAIDRVELSQNGVYGLARYQVTLKVWLDVPVVSKRVIDGENA